MTNNCLYHTGFNVEAVEYKNITFTVWDVGGQDKVKSSAICFIFNFIFIDGVRKNVKKFKGNKDK